jgi:hypothetical protein
MSLFFSIAVHSSIRMERDVYYFIYKNMELKYTSATRPRDTDMLTSRTASQTSTDDIYSLMTEFLSAFAFVADAEIIPEPGASTELNSTLARYTGGYSASRSVPIRERMNEFHYIPPIHNEEQATLLRLYRQARSSRNIYLRILFYWHSLVFPSKDDLSAVDFVDKLCCNLPERLKYISEQIDRIMDAPLFRPPDTEIESLGDYIRDGVRNSIAHIVRDRPGTQNIRLDLHSELRHLNDISRVLHQFSRFRLENDFDINGPHDPEIFRYFDPENQGHDA